MISDRDDKNMEINCMFPFICNSRATRKSKIIYVAQISISDGQHWSRTQPGHQAGVVLELLR